MHRRRIRTQKPRTALVRCSVDEKVRFHSGLVECLGIASIAASLRARGLPEAVILDAELDQLGPNQLLSTLRGEDPDVVGITVPLHHLPSDVATLVAQLRSEGYDGWIVLGGHSPTFFAREALESLPGLDAVFLGEADSSFACFVDHVGQEEPFAEVHGVAYRRDRRVLIQEGFRETPLDGLPMPVRNLTHAVLLRGGLPAISTSRGCSFSCSFCSVGQFYSPRNRFGQRVGKWQARSGQLVVDEIQNLIFDHGCRHFLVVDEEFFGGGSGFRRAEEIADELLRRSLDVQFSVSCRASSVRPALIRKLASAGLRHIYLGAESGAADDLELFGKRLTVDCNTRAIAEIKDAGLSLQLGTIVLHPWSNISSLRQTYSFLRAVGCHGLLTQTTAWIPYYGSRLSAELTDRGWRAEKDNLEIGVIYPKAWQRILFKLFDELQLRLLPIYQALADAYESRTYLWRPQPSLMAPADQFVLASFEAWLNTAIADLLDKALLILEDQIGTKSSEENVWSDLSLAAEALHVLALLRISSISPIVNQRGEHELDHQVPS
jgi:anaerobic magnesium-protoporphyrin IX monomethyl ester cyclase